MTTEIVGYRRLYDSMGCSLAENKDLYYQFPIGNFFAQIYLGPCPKFGIIITDKSDKYFLPNTTSMMLNAQYFHKASESKYPRQFFMEIFCYKQVEVSQEISKAFHAKIPRAQDLLLNLVEQDSDVLKSTVDLIAGTIGLRYHWQFVMLPINENYIAVRDPNDFAYNFTGPAIQILESPRLTSIGEKNLPELLTALGNANEQARSDASIVLRWLIRAWTEEDVVSKFVDLFIPLEMVLSGFSGSIDNIFLGRLDVIREIVEKNGGEQKRDLLNCLNQLAEQQRPSLTSRFEEFATKINAPGFKQDIVAFKKFNSLRNALIHRGNEKITTRVDVSENEVRDLEDLVERYISYTLFTDGQVYQSRFRKTK